MSFGAGDVGYVPQGYGHYIENTGSDDLEMMAVFNNGSYESISITALDGRQPRSPAVDQFRRAARACSPSSPRTR